MLKRKHHPGAADSYAEAFEPTSLMLASAGPALGSYAGAAGFADALAAIQAFGGIAQSFASGAAETRNYRYQAAAAQQQVAYEQQLAQLRERALRKKQDADSARRRALLAKSGVDTTSGSALLASEQYAAEDELDALFERAQGQTRVADRAQAAEMARLRAEEQARSNRRKLGSTLLTNSRNASSGGGFRLF